jgi:hypothetical protein
MLTMQTLVRKPNLDSANLTRGLEEAPRRRRIA